MTEHLTNAGYWDGVWRRGALPRPLDPSDSSLNNFANVRWHQYFSEAFRRIKATSRHSQIKLIEVGCGGSIVLPYFRSQFGFCLSGLDYSPVGCDISNAIHAASGITADIRHGDMFDPPRDWIGAFDIVYSRGLVEHFWPTTMPLRALAQFCKPDGHVLTVIPNFAGLLGAVQKYASPAIYNLHVRLSADDLSAAHSECGLEVIECRYLLTLNLSVVNFSGPGARISEGLGLRLAAWPTKAMWCLHKLGLPEFPTATLSPYIVCLARKSSS